MFLFDIYIVLIFSATLFSNKNNINNKTLLSLLHVILHKLNGEWSENFSATIFEVISVEKHSYDWIMVALDTINRNNTKARPPNNPRNIWAQSLYPSSL